MDAARTRARTATLIAAAVIGGIAAWAVANLEVTTEITHFLPASEDAELAQVAREITGSDLNRSITLLVSAEDEPSTLAATRALAERLRRRDDLAWVRSGPSEDLNEAFHALYFERRHLFYDATPERLPDEALTAAARDLKRRISGPTGAFLSRIAPRDPLLAFPRHLERMRDAQQGGLSIREGGFLTEDGRGVIFLASEASPFDSDASRALVRGIDAAVAEVTAEHGATVAQSGVHRFAVASEAAIRADVTRISVISTIGVLLLFLVLFRSLRYLLLGALPLLAGFAIALAVCMLAFGRIHGLSLAFGATLIGVGIDYVAHALNHHTLSPGPSPEASLRKIWPGLALGAATTLAGLAGLTWTSFPGIRELSVFTSVGVFVALLVTRWGLPPWMPTRPNPTRLHRRLSQRLGGALARLRASRPMLTVLPLLALAISVLGLTRIGWVDDVRALSAIDADLLAEDEAVRDAVSRMDGGRFVIAWAGTEEEALQRNDAVHTILEEAREAGEVERFRSLHALLWSAETQRASRAALADDPTLPTRLERALLEEGFVPGPFAPFAEDLAAEGPAPLTWAELAASPVGPLVASFRVEMGEGRVGFVTLTRGADVDAIAARIDGLEGVRIFDQQRFLPAAYGGFRARTLEMIAVGLVLVFLIVFARYRRLGPALAAFLPAVLAATTALGALALLGFAANLMHLVALLLVLSMGVDYGIFMVESRHHPEGPAPTVVSLVVACVSTVLSFGLLAMSDNPALQALGLVTGIGVTLSLLLAPTAWLLLGRDPK